MSEINKTFKVMKNAIFITLTAVCLTFVMTTPAIPQGNTHDFNEANLIIWYPQTWKLSEHGVHYLMPMDEDLSFQFEVLSAPNFESAVKISEIELKAIFAQDPSLTIVDTETNGMPVKEIEKILGAKEALYYTLQTPDNNYARFFCIGPKDIIAKYRGDIEKIMENVKPNK